MKASELKKLLTTLDILVLEQANSGCFEPLKPMPFFVETVFPQMVDDIEGKRDFCSSPFISYFHDDAKAHWEAGREDQLWSESWVETGEDKHEHSFKVVAVVVDKKKYLVVFKLPELKGDRRELLQQARENLLLQRYLEEEVDRRTQALREREEEIVLRLIGAADYRDEETGSHIRRMGLASAQMAKRLGWNSMRVEKIKLAASMHDVGKIGIPDSILLKPARLTKDDFVIMKTHTLIGGKILQNSKSKLLHMAREIALHHHENWDGSGYPNGLSGKDIPLVARIVSICDVFDALAHDRVYRKAMSMDDVLRTMKELRGIKFDPELFDLFLRILPEILEIKDQYQDENDRGPYVPIWET